MIISKVTIFLIILIIVASVMLAHFAQQIDTDVHSGSGIKNHKHSKKPSDNLISNSSENLIWFLQISDIHISIFHDLSRTTEFQEFCSKTVDAIKPKVVLASGDLTDAKHKNNMGSAQYEQEWMIYKNALDKCGIKNKTTWLDIRGNHDNFNVPNWDSSQNYFKDYSMRGAKHKRSYMQILKEGDEKIAFLAVDACLEPGPRRPFNFMGMLTDNETKHIQNYVQHAEKSNVDHIIWFGHYPSSCVFSFGDTTLRDIIGSAQASKVYLCGHLHQLGGIVTEMYTIQRQGYLELELGDWKDNRMFRLLAVDQGLFSFVDNQHGKWPVTLITNPKHNLFFLPTREPLFKMKHSTHIRLITFSISPIDNVQVKINDGEWLTCEHIKGPLYTLSWNSENYHSGTHMIYAKVRDTEGRERIVKQPFSLDGSKGNFRLLSKTILMLNATTVFQSMFGIMILICIFPLLVLRFFHHRILLGDMKKIVLKRNFFHKWMRKFWFVANIDCLFYPLIIYEVYLIFGPWFVGEVLDGYIGAIFSWGIIVNGSYIPGLFTYVYGFIQMFLCQFPLTAVLAHSADERFRMHILREKSPRLFFVKVFQQMPFILILTVQMVLAYFFWLAYGTMAFLIGPLRSWSVILNIYLWYKAITLPSNCFREMTHVWIFPRSGKSSNLNDARKL